MSSKVQLTGGAFQDSEGNVLVDGYLKLRLSQDASVSGVGNICSGVEITIQLDASGNAVTSPAQYVWGNDNLLPINTYYRVTGYTQSGQPAWGPNNQQIVGSGTFDLGTWVPNQVISWNPPPSGITFENSGTPNSSQIVLNLESTDASITITDVGGGTLNLEVAGGGGTAFPDFMFGIGNFCPLSGAGVAVNTATNDSALRVYAQRFSSPVGFSFSKLSFTAACNLGGGGFINIGVYNDSGSLLFQTGAIAIGNFTELNIDRTLSPVWAGAAGNYYIAWTTTDAGNTTMWGWDFSTFLIDSGNSKRNLLNRNSIVNFGYSPNPATSGAAAMPSSLGSLTASGSSNSKGSPALLFQK